MDCERALFVAAQEAWAAGLAVRAAANPISPQTPTRRELAMVQTVGAPTDARLLEYNRAIAYARYYFARVVNAIRRPIHRAVMRYRCKAAARELLETP